jgi:hypothetical protein
VSDFLIFFVITIMMPFWLVAIEIGVCIGVVVYLSMHLDALKMKILTVHRAHTKLWSDSSFLRATGASLLVLLVGLTLPVLSRYYLNAFAQDAVSTPDFLLDRLPTTDMEGFIIWGVPLTIGILLILLWFYPWRIPFTFKAIGILFFIRAFFIVLTPLGIRDDQIGFLGSGLFFDLAYGTNDFFFSGHVAFPFLFALIFWRELHIRLLFFGIALLFALGVLLAHTHYSIDVFAVPFILPTIYTIVGFFFPEDAKRLHLDPATFHQSS